MIGKHTLLIDGNFFVFSRLFTLPRPKKGKLLEDEEGKGQLMRKLAIDLCSEVRKMYNIIDDIVVTIDSKSWRKDLYPELNYKGDRELDDNIEWDNVYDVYNQFQDILKQIGVKVQKVSGAEGDDIIFQWSVNLNSIGKNVIVWSGDKDLIQLVNYSYSNNSYTICYHSIKSTIYTDDNFYDRIANGGYEKEEENELLFNLEKLDSVEEDSNPVLSWIEDNKIKIENVYCEEFILKKILTGDKSDSIPAVVTWQKTMKNGDIRTYSLTDKNADKIFDQFIKEQKGLLNNKYDFKIDLIFGEEEKDHLADIIYRVMGKMGKEEIKKNLNNNISLMLLHSKVLPEGILNAINKEYDNTSDQVLKKSGLTSLKDKEYLLAGTSWIEQSNSMDGLEGFNIPEETKTTNNSKTKNKNELF